MAPLARPTAVAVGVEVEAGWMKEWERERQEMKCPRDISPGQRRKEGWRAKFKTAARASNPSFCSTFQPEDRGNTVTVKRVGEHNRKWKRNQEGVSYQWTLYSPWPSHLSLIKNQCSWCSIAGKYTFWVYEPIQSLISSTSCSQALQTLTGCLIGSNSSERINVYWGECCHSVDVLSGGVVIACVRVIVIAQGEWRM